MKKCRIKTHAFKEMHFNQVYSRLVPTVDRYKLYYLLRIGYLDFRLYGQHGTTYFSNMGILY